MCVEGLTFEVDHRAAGRGCQRIGERFGLKPQLIDVVVKRGRGHREAHAAQFGDHPLAALEGLGAQTPAHFRGFIHHGFEAQLHQFIRRNHPGHACPDNRHLRAQLVRGNTAQTCRVFNPVIEGKREVRAENRDWFFAIMGVAIILVHG